MHFILACVSLADEGRIERKLSQPPDTVSGMINCMCRPVFAI